MSDCRPGSRESSDVWAWRRGSCLRPNRKGGGFGEQKAETRQKGGVVEFELAADRGHKGKAGARVL